jgi:hypothetical protein
MIHLHRTEFFSISAVESIDPGTHVEVHDPATAQTFSGVVKVFYVADPPAGWTLGIKVDGYTDIFLYTHRLTPKLIIRDFHKP